MEMEMEMERERERGERKPLRRICAERILAPLIAAFLQNRRANGHRRRYLVKMTMEPTDFIQIRSAVSVSSRKSSIFAK